jgi:putative membrane protein
MVKHPVLSKQDQALIEQAVKRAEAETSGEILTVVARQSDHYLAKSLGLSIVAGFTAGLLAHLWNPVYGYDRLTLIEMAALLVTLAMLQFTSLHIRLVPPSRRRRAVRRLAHEQFTLHGLHRTSHRASILILLSLNERCVELIADTGIDTKVEQAAWKQIADRLAADIRAKGPGLALANAVDACAVLLKAHFPAVPGASNDLPDAPVLLD